MWGLSFSVIEFAPGAAVERYENNGGHPFVSETRGTPQSGEIAVMRITLSLWIASALAVAVASAPARAYPVLADNAFSVVQAGGANYVAAVGPVACGAGMCITTLKPAIVTDLGAMTAKNTANLAADLAAERAGFSIADLGAQLDINFVITQYKAFQNGTTAGGILEVDFSNPRHTVLPADLHWVQIVIDNYNTTGVNGADLNAAKGPGKPENVVDAPNAPKSPYYDVSSLAATPPFNTNPPHFEDMSSRPDPTAANPEIDWAATLFLVSDPGTGKMTVYDAVEWGWVADYVCRPAPGTNQCSIPEPPSWMMLLVGIGATGVIWRRGRQRLGSPQIARNVTA